MNKVAIICILVFTTVLLSVTTGCAEAIFEVSNLAISSQEVESGESATVSVDITNTGGAEGSYPVLLKIDGAQIEEKNLTVSPDTTEQVTFFVTREKAGNYTVDVNGLTVDYLDLRDRSEPSHPRTAVRRISQPVERVLDIARGKGFAVMENHIIS